MDSVCSHCGAPARPGIIVCEFCENAVDPEAARRAIKCKKCTTLNVETAQQCLKCKDWLVVQCVFCSRTTRQDAANCSSCGEAFMGAAERKAQRDAQLRNQQILNTAVAVAPLAGGLLGGVAGAIFGGSSSHSEHHQYSGSGMHNSHNYGHHGSSNEAPSLWNSNDDSQSRGSSGGGGFMESVSEMFSGNSDDNQSRGSSDDDSTSRGSSDDDDSGGSRGYSGDDDDDDNGRG